MSGARDDILGAVRRATGGAAAPGRDEAVRDFEARLAAPHANLVPERGQGSPEALEARFVAGAEASAATLARIASRTAIPVAVADYLAANGLPSAVRAAPALETVPWAQQPGLTVSFGRAEAETLVSISEAVAGIAETGTLVLPSGLRTPSTLNYLPDVEIVVLERARIVGAYEDAWAAIRAGAGPDGAFMPRAINWITGPSRSADIELVLLLGVHGPRRLHILLVDGEIA
jgi:L-lactate dehydrogenase complex protein LldG